jgi:hypothetical protein
MSSSKDAISAFNKFNDLLEKKVKSKVSLMGFSDIDEYIPTGNYLLNAQLSGSLFGGYPNTRSIGIAGDSGAGKDTLSNALEGLFGEYSVTKISGDNYHLYSRGEPVWDLITHLNPKANDLKKSSSDLATLISRKNIYSKMVNRLFLAYSG